MVDGQPDWRRFEKAMRAAVREVRPAPGVEGLRAYGEMVAVLWKAHQYGAAIRLEQLWNKLLEQLSFSLYCSYAVDLLGDESELANLETVLCAHTHLIPSSPDDRLEAAIYRAMDKVLGERAGEMQAQIKTSHRVSGTILPSGENTVLWLRRNLPAEADRIVSLAREYYRQQAQTMAS